MDMNGNNRKKGKKGKMGKQDEDGCGSSSNTIPVTRPLQDESSKLFDIFLRKFNRIEDVFECQEADKNLSTRIDMLLWLHVHSVRMNPSQLTVQVKDFEQEIVGNFTMELFVWFFKKKLPELKHLGLEDLQNEGDKNFKKTIKQFDSIKGKIVKTLFFDCDTFSLESLTVEPQWYYDAEQMRLRAAPYDEIAVLMHKHGQSLTTFRTGPPGKHCQLTYNNGDVHGFWTMPDSSSTRKLQALAFHWQLMIEFCSESQRPDPPSLLTFSHSTHSDYKPRMSLFGTALNFGGRRFVAESGFCELSTVKHFDGVVDRINKYNLLSPRNRVEELSVCEWPEIEANVCTTGISAVMFCTLHAIRAVPLHIYRFPSPSSLRLLFPKLKEFSCDEILPKDTQKDVCSLIRVTEFVVILAKVTAAVIQVYGSAPFNVSFTLNCERMDFSGNEFRHFKSLLNYFATEKSLITETQTDEHKHHFVVQKNNIKVTYSNMKFR